MRTTFPLLALAASCVASAHLAHAQGLPTSQPSLLTIVREDVKVGRAADHAKLEAGWPAAYARAKSPDYYLALVSLTGPSEAWYLTPYASHAKMAEGMKRDAADPVLTAELDRLSKADGELLNNLRVFQAAARPDLSYGAYPNMALQRFWEVTWFRVRPGHEASFEAAAKAYGSSTKRTSPDASYRVYEVIAGLPGPTYLVFSSVAGYADFDQVAASGQKTMAGVTQEEGAALQKFAREGMINAETQRFRLSAEMSYTAAETRAQDPAFWSPKKAAKP